jgi:glutaminase
MQNILDKALRQGRSVTGLGEVASYIPELSKADKNHVGVCVMDCVGGCFEAGDVDVRFTVQSISKVVSLAIALELYGMEAVFGQIGMEPSGDAFNSIVKLAGDASRPYNPMVNSGAIAVASYIAPELTFEEMLERTRELCGDPEIAFNEAVYHSEMSTTSRNRAICYLLESKGVLRCGVDEALELYIKMCSLNVTARDLAYLGLVLANGGVRLQDGKQLLQPETVRVVKSIMLTCGMYDGSGEFAVRVGVPTKSGVGGGLLSVVNKRMGIGIFGPSLDKKGNSIAGEKILQYLSAQLKLHVFD